MPELPEVEVVRRDLERELIGKRVKSVEVDGMRTVLLRTGRHIAQQPRSWDEQPDVEVHTTAELLPAILSLVDEAP